jgi:2-polyprenyl-3-methyl-5-hydroxy-6-metoxy-1,4-benzoquinol methylase
MESAFFDESVGTYIDSMATRNFAARQRAFRAAAELALERAGSDPAAVDVGVGTGYLTRAVASLGFRVTGCDSSPEMLKVAAESVPSADLRLGDGADFLRTLPAESADLVTCSSVLEYLPEPLAIIQLGAPVLRPGGIFAVSLPERLSLSRALEAPFMLRGPKAQRYSSQWRNRLSGRDLETASSREGLRLIHRRRFGSFERRGLRLPLESHRPVATLCLYVFERPGS